MSTDNVSTTASSANCASKDEYLAANGNCGLCSPVCDGCFGAGDTKCVSCKMLRFYSICVTDCPKGFEVIDPNIDNVCRMSTSILIVFVTISFLISWFALSVLCRWKSYRKSMKRPSLAPKFRGIITHDERNLEDNLYQNVCHDLHQNYQIEGNQDEELQDDSSGVQCSITEHHFDSCPIRPIYSKQNHGNGSAFKQKLVTNTNSSIAPMDQYITA